MRQEDKTGDDPTLADLAKHMDGLAKRMDAGFAKVDKRFDEVDKRFEKVDAKFEKVDAKFEKVDDRFESLRLEMKGDLKHLDSKIDKLVALIVAVCIAIAGLMGADATGFIGG